ncbi:hypothetical protein [Mucisphaera calidilacus]|uniref:PEP-CTERM protein-sorting domain-containing protein n=1 Tax=Mucisphaera calidilacus TaxID=2527982 RepID=A0A518BTM5_9BACT|nr:hypothetical protein [Mucisphaera calidilacus]QDU70317.1 hypothetical protein Pan265_01400 [Mucisphaera calidilacus]
MKISTLAALGALTLTASHAMAGSVTTLPASGTADLRDNRDATGTTTPDNGILVFEEFSGLSLSSITDLIGSDYIETVSAAGGTLVDVHYVHYDPDHATGGTLDMSFDFEATILGYFGADNALNTFEQAITSLWDEATYVPATLGVDVLYPTNARDRGAGAGGGGINDVTTVAGTTADFNWYVPGNARIDTMRVVTQHQVAPPPIPAPSPAAAAGGLVLLGLMAARRARR